MTAPMTAPAPAAPEPITGNWRAQVPQRFHSLHDMITIKDMTAVFGYTAVYLRRLRSNRLKADRRGAYGDRVDALPRALAVSGRPVLWNAYEIIQWGIQTGRIDPITGDVRRLSSS